MTASGLTKLTAHAIAKSGAMQRDNWLVAKGQCFTSTAAANAHSACGWSTTDDDVAV